MVWTVLSSEVPHGLTGSRLLVEEIAMGNVVCAAEIAMGNVVCAEGTATGKGALHGREVTWDASSDFEPAIENESAKWTPSRVAGVVGLDHFHGDRLQTHASSRIS